MTDQPTDHRAEAAGRLSTAATLADAPTSSTTREAAIAEALIGIGHALLAQDHDAPMAELERRMEALAQLFTVGGSMPTAAAVRNALRGHANGHHYPADTGVTT